jgi:hypothetical protein
MAKESQMKKGVKRTKQSRNEYLAKKQTDHDIWTLKVFAYTQQEILDAVAITLMNEFGFGEKRQKQFHDAFEKVYEEIQELEKTDDEYAIAKQEQALKAAYGQYYTPREERYKITIIDREGREHRFE